MRRSNEDILNELVPDGMVTKVAQASQDEVRSWMFGEAHLHENMTTLAESAADLFDMDFALDDETHWIWDLAFDAWIASFGM